MLHFVICVTRLQFSKMILILDVNCLLDETRIRLSICLRNRTAMGPPVKVFLNITGFDFLYVLFYEYIVKTFIYNV